MIFDDLPVESILRILKSGVLNPEGVIEAVPGDGVGNVENLPKAAQSVRPVSTSDQPPKAAQSVRPVSTSEQPLDLSKKCSVRISEVSRGHGSNDAPSDGPHGSNDAPLDAFEKASKVINDKPSTSKNQSIPSNAVAHFTGCSEARKNGSTDGVVCEVVKNQSVLNLHNENDQVATGSRGGSNSEFKHLIILSRSVRKIKKFNTISQNIISHLKMPNRRIT
ncbi:hypothetical protein FQR65_LT16540 [Abscondita terminalis]|nr:hypothetical protein FQR65_LT16540 [Abscondita terminalis]